MATLINNLKKFHKVIIVLADLILINLAYILAFLVKFKGDLPDFNFGPYIDIAPFITIAALVFFDIFGILKFYKKTLYDFIISITYVVFLLGITTTAIAYFSQGFSFPRSVLLMAPVFQFVLLSLWYGLVFFARKSSTGVMKLMVIGFSEDMKDILDKVSIALTSSEVAIKCVYSPDEMDKIRKRLKDVDEVLLCPGLTDEQKMKISNLCLANRKVVYVVPELFEISLMNTRLVQFEDVPAFMIDRIGLTVEQRFFKRVFDIVFSFIGIVILSPLMLVTALLIRLTSPGRIIFVQERVTIKDKVFCIYKFRTMREDAEKETGPVISGRNDPRVTPIGRILRKFRIDEIPQLFNVLKGDMSIVGPRSERPYFVEQYEKEIPEYAQRSVVKAGITGYAQILGNYDTTAENKLKYDLIYIKNYSLLLDLKLMLQTVKVVFTGNNAYNETFSDNAEKHGKTLSF